MDSQESLPGNRVNRAIREALRKLEPAERTRYDRQATYAVALGERLGYGQEDLWSIRLRLAGADGVSARSKDLQSLLKAVQEFENEVWPKTGDIRDPNEVLTELEANSAENRDLYAALRSLLPLVQPLTLERT